MHHNAEAEFILTRNQSLKFSETTLSAKTFWEILQRNRFLNIKKLEIAHSKIDPEIFKIIPEDLEELSLHSVTDLHGNILSTR